jgi:general secretion pathway protein G
MQTYRRYKDTTQDAFTFIEIIVALAILGLLAAVGIPTYMGFVERGRVRSAEAAIQNMKTAILQFNLEVGGYPRTLRELEVRPTDERGKKWRGPYIQEMPENDGWGNPYVYRPTQGQKNPYELYSTGAQGSEGTKEDRIGVYN